ncbi:hypothetical protein L3Y34_001766 [Caenorhabditis briggsae]|uniref:Uncharacterized protein n=1 Tax=Caenorhabditis briggsae TaxID=6238 RepID=A0AAE9DDW4_CAEBR|nr:hypothetical protein L3Y34_001766 [Caenorhabditis briggsae]
MRKQLRRFHKESNNYDVYFKSQAYWKSFYKGLINHCGDMMDCFRFDDLRDVQKIVESHDLPDELLSFVTQQLMEWRELFKDVEWLKRFRETSKKVEAYQQKCQEQADRLMVLNEIGLEFEACNLKYHNFNKNDKNIVDSITSAILNMRITRKPLDGLKHVPMLSKRISVKRWYQKHYDPLSQTESDNESDDDGSSDSENSSLRNGAANSNADDAADISSDEAENDNDFDAFFND